ncbi:MAG: serine hydrolase domain-containing protein [Bacteroidia bacterium]
MPDNTMKLRTSILLLFTLMATLIKAQKSDSSFRSKRVSYLSDNKKQTTLDTVVEKAIIDFIQSPENCGISIGIIKNDTDFFYNYGETKRNNKTLPTKNTLFEIGSITKTFCGIILAYAVSEGKIKLDDDIRKFLPGKYPNLETNKRFIQVKHLANHTSGLPRIPEDMHSQFNFDKLDPYKSYDRKMMLSYLKTVNLSTQPGTVCEYSNYGMALLGLILEKVYDKSFEELVKEKICLPNNMNSTSINLTSAQSDIFATGYNKTGDWTPHWHIDGMVAAGGIKSSTADMLAYLHYNINEKDSAIKLAHISTFKDRSNIALAWNIIHTKAGNELIWHNGATFGFSSFCGFIKDKKTAFVILSNSGTNVDYIGLAILKFLQK